MTTFGFAEFCVIFLNYVLLISSNIKSHLFWCYAYIIYKHIKPKI